VDVPGRPSSGNDNASRVPGSAWRPPAPAPAVDQGTPGRTRLQQLEGELVPAWRRPTDAENRLPAAAAIIAAVVMQLTLPNKYGLHPRWLLPAAELLLLAVLSVLNPVRLTRATRLGKYTSLLVVAVITVDNASSAGLLDYDILTGKASQDAGGLLSAGAAVYLTNIIAFGLWFWEIDRGGPFTRAEGSRTHPDFLFPQMASPQVAHPDWEPRFVDYLYLSFTNAVAFSPTDTLPLTRPVKALMALQSLVALSTIALVIARAVNVLK